MDAQKKQPRRPHFIKEWSDARGFTQARLSRELGADKSVISRWYAGAAPSIDYQTRLSELFKCEPDSLFRHPDEDWLAKFMRGRDPDEIEKIKATLSAAFPR